MKRGVRPVADPRDQAVLERIDVAILDMASIVGLIPDHMFPEPPLPDAALAAHLADGAQPFLFRQRFGKAALDQSPSGREIAVVGWQRPNRVQMIRQDHEGVDGEGVASPRRGDRLAQLGDMIDKQGFAPLQQVDCEKEAPARDERATIVRHGVQDNTIVLAAVKLEMADYAFGSNPPYGL
jgi:hypothetical protein